MPYCGLHTGDLNALVRFEIIENENNAAPHN